MSDVELYLPPAGLPYGEVWEWQRRRAAAVARGEAPEALVLLEHAPVYTMGRRSDPNHLLRSENDLRALGAEVYWIDRGGDATWHGPGQITGYPILDLNRCGRDLHAYVAALEQLLIDVAAGYGIAAERAQGMTGVWVGQEKLAAIGIRVVRWVTYHGFALNVAPDLRWFEQIVPCGLHGLGATSLERLVSPAPSVGGVAERLAQEFERAFRVRLVDGGSLDRPLALAQGEDFPSVLTQRRSG